MKKKIRVSYMQRNGTTTFYGAGFFGDDPVVARIDIERCEDNKEMFKILDVVPIAKFDSVSECHAFANEVFTMKYGGFGYSVLDVDAEVTETEDDKEV